MTSRSCVSEEMKNGGGRKKGNQFFKELVHGKDFAKEPAGLPNKPLNKKITFSYSDDEEDDDDEEEGDEEGEEKGQEEMIKSDTSRESDADQERLTNKDLDHHNSDDVCHGKVTEETKDSKKDGANIENQADNSKEPPAKKQCLEIDTSKCATNEKETSIDKLIEAELTELGDKSKVVMVLSLSKDIVEHMMMSAASTRKQMSRFILRVLPAEVACYASEEEITRAMKPLIVQYFPVEKQNPKKVTVSVFSELNEFCETACLIGVVEKYKELGKI